YRFIGPPPAAFQACPAALLPTNAAMASMLSKLSMLASWACTSIPKRSSTKLTRRSVAMESRMPLVRSGVSSFRLEGFSPGKNSERMYCRSSSLTLSISNPQALGDDVALDFRGSRIDCAAHGIAQLALHALLHHVAIAAVDLHRVHAGGHQRFGNVQFGHGSFQNGRTLALLQPADAVNQRTANVEPHLHVDHAIGDRLILADGLAEL